MTEGAPAQHKRRRLLEAVADLPAVQPLQDAAPPHTNQHPPPHLIQPAAAAAAAAVDDDPDLDNIHLPSDVEAAILFLRQEAAVPIVQKGSGTGAGGEGGRGGGRGIGLISLPPLVLVSQVHSMVKDRRLIDQELEEMRRKNVVRCLKLSTGVDEHGLLMTTDYVRVVRDAAAAQAQHKQQQKQQNQHEYRDSEEGQRYAQSSAGRDAGQAGKPTMAIEQAIAEVFCTNVVPNHTEVSISQHRLLALMRSGAKLPVGGAAGAAGAAGSQPATAAAAAAATAAAASAPVGTAAGPVTADQAVCVLLQLGVLARHSVDDGSFLFCCPGLGPVIKSILAGRKELLAFISKKPRKEVSEKALVGSALPQPPATAGNGSNRQMGSSGWGGPGRPPANMEGGFLRPLEIDLGETEGDGTQGKGKKKGRGGKEVVSVSAPRGGRVAASGSPGLKMRQSVLNVRYHVRDLLGRGDLMRVPSTAGDMIKIVDRGGQQGGRAGGW